METQELEKSTKNFKAQEEISFLNKEYLKLLLMFNRIKALVV